MTGEASDGQLKAWLRQEVMHDLSQDDGLMPVYRSDVLSEEDFEARLEELPLIVIWNERMAGDGVDFSISVNSLKVVEAVARHLSVEDPWAPEIFHELVRDLQSLTNASMQRTVGATGLPPSEICRSLPLSR